MRHLSEEELIDLAEAAGAERDQPHLASCEGCRAQLRDLRAMMSAAADVEVPEPSPLFWEHFSNRVRAAVAEEASPRAPGWLSWRLVMPAVALVALVLAVVTLRPSPMPPSDQPVALQATGNSRPDILDPVSLVDDPSLSLIADLASDLDLDAVAEAGLTTGAGALDSVLLEMSGDERRALQIILKQEMSRPGA